MRTLPTTKQRAGGETCLQLRAKRAEHDKARARGSKSAFSLTAQQKLVHWRRQLPKAAAGHGHGVPAGRDRPRRAWRSRAIGCLQSRTVRRETRTTARPAAANDCRRHYKRRRTTRQIAAQTVFPTATSSADRRGSTSSSSTAFVGRRENGGLSRRPATIGRVGETMKSRLLIEPSPTRLRRASSTATYGTCRLRRIAFERGLVVIVAVGHGTGIRSQGAENKR